MARAHGGDGYVVSERLASEVDHRETRQLEPVEPETSSGLCLGAQRIAGHQTGLDGQLDHWARPAGDAVAEAVAGSPSSAARSVATDRSMPSSADARGSSCSIEITWS